MGHRLRESNIVAASVVPHPMSTTCFTVAGSRRAKNTCCDLSRAVADAVADVGCQHRLLSRLLADPEYLKPGANPNPPKWSKLVWVFKWPALHTKHINDISGKLEVTFQETWSGEYQVSSMVGFNALKPRPFRFTWNSLEHRADNCNKSHPFNPPACMWRYYCLQLRVCHCALCILCPCHFKARHGNFGSKYLVICTEGNYSSHHQIGVSGTGVYPAHWQCSNRKMMINRWIIQWI